ncbi:uncharacterized protein LOC110717705 isoform X2 [Chenopodium quinoa]|uniref:uncharacterized protein LOC110717705 isoform X2 n=1 Tax=Chenopodium quinoa TaxID=63459 RepID=UPI000B77BC8D|nr:uncharacterized protein LOC110717705 isoform X2 [Chenopodium quinoa]
MVLKKNDQTADLCQAADDSEDPSSTLEASEWRRDQKGLGQGNDANFNNKKTDIANEVLCSGTDKNDRSGSCENGLVNNLGQGVEAVDLRNNPGSLGLDYDMEDGHLESRKNSQSSEATIQRLSASPSDSFHGQNEKVMQSYEVMESDEKFESSLQTSHGDDVDESDVEEEDVKVCDICGDAGREDLLAVCSRCSDGAEHTYCMRVMLEKVPEGDWFCEECKYNEELEARRQEPVKLGSTERSKSLGRTSSVNSDPSTKLDNKDSLFERSKLKTVSLSKQLSAKRSGDSIEAGPTAKKQVFESSAGSPTALSPSRVPVLSRDSSLKNTDKTKGKLTNQYSTGTESAGDSSESTRSPTKNSHILKGNFAKSNSFGSSNLKATVKVSEEVVQKQRQGGVDAKDGLGKLIGKSTSFKGLGRSSLTEPKVKMLSPKCAPVQELKGQKQVRDRGSFERKNSIKSDHSFPVQSAANSSKRLPRVENISVSNSRDYKNAQSDGKSTSLSKQACNLAHKSPESMGSSGEAKRLSGTSIRGSGTSSSAEAKPSHGSLKEGPALNSLRTADGSLVGTNGAKADGHDNQTEKALEDNVGRSRHGVNGALISGNRRGVSSDVSLSRVKDGMHEENKLKAAIEAAMQKKQHIFKKNKIPEKLNELSVAISQGNQEGDAVLNQPMDLIAEEAVHARDAGLFSNTSNSFKHTSVSTAKEFKVYPADVVLSSEEDSVLTSSAIPEQEAVWQGGFEIHRNGKLSDVCGGFQAHLSSCASGKVLEVVSKLPQKIVFNEVSRPCAWPIQFKEAGPSEDNIALYFFAKDLESYMRSYKNMLEYMMKHDLALKGNVNGVELLIFPSNQLSHRSQRWNTLYFMWGVFRGRRARCSDDRNASLERPEISVSVANMVPRDKDVSATCLSEDTCLQRPAVEDLSVSGNDTVVPRCEAPVLDGSSLQKSGSLSNGDCSDQGFNVGRTNLSSPTSQGDLDKITEKCSSVLGTEACSVSRTAALEDQNRQDPCVILKHQQSTHSGNNLHEPKKSLSDLVSEKRDISSDSFKVLMESKQEDCSASTLEEQEVLHTVCNKIYEKSENHLKQEDQCVNNIQENGCQAKLENSVEQVDKNHSVWKNDEVKLNWNGGLKQEGFVDINVSVDGSMEALPVLQCSPKRHSDEDSKPTIEATSVIPCQKRPWAEMKDGSEGSEQACISKRLKEDDDLYSCDRRSIPSAFSDRFAAQMRDVSTSSRTENTSNEAVDGKSTLVNPESAERCFFLVDPHAVQSNSSEDHSSPWKASLLGNENRLPDGSPNLELALGVEKKQSRKGVLPFYAGIVDRKGPDRPPDLPSPKEEDEDASASLSLSLAFPFSGKESPVRP